jgi:hypothetical protein
MIPRLHTAAILALTLAGCGTSPIDAVGVAPNALAVGLVGHWPFDDAAGQATKDRSGNGRDGVITGGTWLSDGRFADALRLNTYDYVRIDNFPQAAPSWTVSVWLRQLTADLAWNTATVLSTEIVNQGGWELNLFPPNGGNPNMVEFAYWYQPINNYVGVRCNCLVADVWVHLAAVVDAEKSEIRLYQNGALQASTPMPGAIAPGNPFLLMGAWNNPTDPRPYNGALDDAAIFNRALRAEEIRLLSERAVTAP